MIKSDIQPDSFAVDTCGINPMNDSCEYLRYLLVVPNNVARPKVYAKGPWLLKLKDSTIVLPPMPTRLEDTTFINYQGLTDSTLRSIFLDIEQRYGSLSLYRLLRNKDEDYHMYLYFNDYVHALTIAQYFDSLNYFTHHLETGVAMTSDNIIYQNKKQNFQLINNMVNNFLRIKINDSDKNYHYMQIHDIYGNKIIDNKAISNNLSLSIDVSELPVGMYIASIGSLYQLFYIVR